MTTDTIGGVWTFTTELAESLGSRDIEVVLAALGGAPNSSQQSAAARIPTMRLLAGEFKLEWMDDPWRDVERSGRWLLHLEEEYTPDLVHLNSFGHGALAWRTPVVMTAHSCVSSWWAAVKREPLPPEWNRYCGLVAGSLKAADVVTAPSRAMAQTLAASYGFDTSDCVVIPNGRRAALFRREPKQELILTAGRLWDEAKNIQAIVDLAPRLSWPVYVAGEQRHPNGEYISLQGCRALGQLAADELADWYTRAAIYALPARYEPFGLSALEAALSGCALVLGDIASLREVWDDAAIFVPPEDCDALQSVLCALIDNDVLRNRMAERAMERSRAFTPERTASEYLSAYQMAVDRRPACVS